MLVPSISSSSRAVSANNGCWEWIAEDDQGQPLPRHLPPSRGGPQGRVIAVGRRGPRSATVEAPLQLVNFHDFNGTNQMLISNKHATANPSTGRYWRIEKGDVLSTLTNDGRGFLRCRAHGLALWLDLHGEEVGRGNSPPTMVCRELLRVAKPGAMLLAFGSPRTYHRLACRIEDAGLASPGTVSCGYMARDFRSLSTSVRPSIGSSGRSGRWSAPSRIRTVVSVPTIATGSNRPTRRSRSRFLPTPEAALWDGYGDGH